MQNDSGLIYYFLIGNIKTGKEIGSFIDNTSTINTISEFNEIISSSKEIFNTAQKNNIKNKKGKYELRNHNIYFITKGKDTFYLVAVRKTSKLCSNENLIFELIEDIEHQGIKKLLDKNGELANVGKQNLKFSIEKYQETIKDKFNIYDEYSDNTPIEQFSVIEPLNKINNINTQINDIKDEVSYSVHNMVTNINDMEDIQNKSEKIKDISLQFKNDSIKFERQLLWQKYKFKIILALFIIFIIIIIIIIKI